VELHAAGFTGRLKGKPQGSSGRATTDHSRHAQVGNGRTPGKRWPRWWKGRRPLRDHEQVAEACVEQQLDRHPVNRRSQHRCVGMLAPIPPRCMRSGCCGDGAIHRQEAPVALRQLGEHRLGQLYLISYSADAMPRLLTACVH